MTKRVQDCLNIYRQAVVGRAMEILSDEQEEILLGRIDMLYNQMSAEEASLAEVLLEKVAKELENPVTQVQAESRLRLVARRVDEHTHEFPRVEAA